MGHAHHFLSRLDRVSLPHVELALSLYRDDALLRFILQSARIPEGAERVAISLDDPAQGPFIVVTREGRFVTCLGEGMSVGDRHVITRVQLEGLAVRHGALRERMEACKKLSGERGGTGKLLRRIYEAGDNLSREELTAASALQPLYRLEFLNFVLAANHDLSVAREFFEREMRRSDKLDKRHDEALHRYWKTLWSLAHLTVLTADDGRATLESLPASVQPMLTHEATISWPAVRQGMLAIAARGVWAAGRVGKLHLPAYKRRFADAATFFTVIDGAMGLAVIGMRHARLRAEVMKALAAGPDLEEEGAYANLIRTLGETASKLFGTAEDTAEWSRLHRGIGSALAVKYSKYLPESFPYRYAREEDVPEELAMTLGANHPADLVTKSSAALFLASMVPWLARASAEDLYLPAAYLAEARIKWEPIRTMVALRAHQHVLTKGVPVVQQPEGPSRSGPCPCGSGKKYKRCCGEKKP